MKRWLQEPLLHFLLIGAGLFVLFYQVADPEDVTDNRIVVSESDIERIITLFERKLQRLPTQQELNGLVEAEVREEILYREALAMGLDEDDTIVRRRMAQKVEFLFNDLVEAAEPTEEELRQYLDQYPEQFFEPERLSFVHVYFNADKRSDNTRADAQHVLSQLNAEQGGIDPASAGDTFMFGYAFADQSERQVARMFGTEFVSALASLETGSWQGPVVSAYGLHLVYIEERTQPRLPPLDEIRDTVLNELLAERRKQANQAFYKALRERYDVVVEHRPELQGMSGAQGVQ